MAIERFPGQPQPRRIFQRVIHDDQILGRSIPPPRAMAFLATALLWLLALLAAPASAEERVALVIGNAGYKDAPLDNPYNDAADMAKALQAAASG